MTWCLELIRVRIRGLNWKCFDCGMDSRELKPYTTENFHHHQMLTYIHMDIYFFPLYGFYPWLYIDIELDIFTTTSCTADTRISPNQRSPSSTIHSLLSDRDNRTRRSLYCWPCENYQLCIIPAISDAFLFACFSCSHTFILSCSSSSSAYPSCVISSIPFICIHLIAK